MGPTNEWGPIGIFRVSPSLNSGCSSLTAPFNHAHFIPSLLRPVRDPRWVDLQGARRVPFQLQSVLMAATASDTVYVVEEESGGHWAHGTRLTQRFLNAAGHNEPTL